MAKLSEYSVTDPRGVAYTVLLTDKSAKARGAKKVTKSVGHRAAAGDDKSAADAKSAADDKSGASKS